MGKDGWKLQFAKLACAEVAASVFLFIARSGWQLL
jgi:hypothetical protein